MKPFDLEKALAGEPVVTRDGEDVTQLHLFDAENDYYPLVGAIDGTIEMWTPNGKYHTEGENEFDLFMKPKTVVKWVILDEGGHWYGYDSEDEAELITTRYNCIGNKAHRIEWEE